MMLTCSFCCDLEHRMMPEKMVPLRLGRYGNEMIISLCYDETEGHRLVSALWADSGEESVEELSMEINYCPVCGRSLQAKL